MRRQSPFSLRALKAIGGRSAAVGVAAAIVLVPALVSTPAFADPVSTFPITSVSFNQTVLSGGEQATGYFNGDQSLTQLTVADDGFVCEGWYKNGEPAKDGSAIGTASVHISYDYLVSGFDFAEGDTFGLAYFAPNTVDTEGADSCAVPAFDTVGIATATLTLGAATVVPPPICTVESTVTVSPVRLTQGVAVDQVVSYQTASGWDWASGAGWIAAGPQSGSGGLSVLEGLSFITQDPAPGVAPTVRIVGTPSYSGTIATGLALCDGTNFAAGELTVEVAAPANNMAVNLNLAVGQPVAGAMTEVFASGLKPGAAWSVTVRSTPVVVGSGTVAENGQLAAKFTIPAGLTAGLHSITLESTLADGSAASSVLWFTVSSSGTLLAVSTDKSELEGSLLAETGTESNSAFAAAGMLLLGGVVLMGLVAYRRRTAGAQS